MTAPPAPPMDSFSKPPRIPCCLWNELQLSWHALHSPWHCSLRRIHFPLLLCALSSIKSRGLSPSPEPPSGDSTAPSLCSCSAFSWKVFAQPLLPSLVPPAMLFLCHSSRKLSLSLLVSPKSSVPSIELCLLVLLLKLTLLYFIYGKLRTAPCPHTVHFPLTGKPN